MQEVVAKLGILEEKVNMTVSQAKVNDQKVARTEAKVSRIETLLETLVAQVTMSNQ